MEHRPDMRFAQGHCRLCGADLEAKAWVLLNRYMYGTGRCRGATESLNDDGDYEWEVGADLDAEAEVVSGPVLCFPGCVQTFLEGKMIEADIKMGHTR